MTKGLSVVTAFAVILICLALAAPMAGKAEAARPKGVDTSGRFRFDLGLGLGKGFTREYVGDRTDGEPIHLRGGSGIGFTAGIGYGLSSKLDLDIAYSSRSTNNKDTFVQGHAEVKKKRLLATLKYKFPVRSSIDFYGGQIKLGAGLGYYFDMNMGLYYTDTSTDEYSTYVVTYEPALGYHFCTEFETLMPNDWAFTMGIIVYFVDIGGGDETHTGPYGTYFDDTTKFESMDGNGAELFFTLGKYFDSPI